MGMDCGSIDHPSGKTVRSLLILIFIFFATLQNLRAVIDSLVRFQDLKFHSEFEEAAFRGFVLNRADTFNLFLAVDESVTPDQAEDWYREYKDVSGVLSRKKVHNKNMDRKIRMAHTAVHQRLLGKYVDTRYFPSIFRDGTYNCVTASLLYALVFNELNIPFRVMASSDHVYLAANPGRKEVVIETTTPSLTQAIFTAELKQQYVNYLRDLNQISEEDYRSGSLEEIFEAAFREIRSATFENLPGLQYYNKACHLYNEGNYHKAYECSQKAYFLYPDREVRAQLYATLLHQIDECSFGEVEDIDYIAQLSRFGNKSHTAVIGLFSNTILHQLQYIDREDFYDSIHTRLISNIDDDDLSKELSFQYYLRMSYRFQDSDRAEYYSGNAVKINNNHRDALEILSKSVLKKLLAIQDTKAVLDSISQFERRYEPERVNQAFSDLKSTALVDMASECFRQKKIEDGEAYLKRFEEQSMTPLENPALIQRIEIAYRTAASCYFNSNYKTRSREILERGLKYAPDSNILKSAGGIHLTKDAGRR